MLKRNRGKYKLFSRDIMKICDHPAFTHEKEVIIIDNSKERTQKSACEKRKRNMIKISKCVNSARRKTIYHSYATYACAAT